MSNSEKDTHFETTHPFCTQSLILSRNSSFSGSLKRSNSAYTFHQEMPGQVLPAPMLFFPFLLFQFKLPLPFCLPLFPAHNFAFSFQLLLL